MIFLKINFLLYRSSLNLKKSNRIFFISFLFFCTASLSASFLFGQEMTKNLSSSNISTLTKASSKEAAEATPPLENCYDVLSKVLMPLTAVFFGGEQSSVRAVKLRMTVEQILGNFPPAFKGATVQAAFQYPDKARIEVPFEGSRLTICRTGNKVWAFPGSKIVPLLAKAEDSPNIHSQLTSPLTLSITGQQAVLLPALFELDQSLKLATVHGTPCRALHGQLESEFAEAISLKDFSTNIWVAPQYLPRRIDIKRQQFALSLIVDEIAYSKELPLSTWQEPKNETDIYRGHAEQLQTLLKMVVLDREPGS